MTIGARDNIDQEIVNKYSRLQVDNPETTKLVDYQTMLNAMQDYSNLQRDMLSVNQKLKDICSGINSKSVKYMRINFNPPKRR